MKLNKLLELLRNCAKLQDPKSKADVYVPGVGQVHGVRWDPDGDLQLIVNPPRAKKS